MFDCGALVQPHTPVTKASQLLIPAQKLSAILTLML